MDKEKETEKEFTDKGTGIITGATRDEIEQDEKQETAQRIYDTFLRGSYK